MLELWDFSSLHLEERSKSSLINCGKITRWLSSEPLPCSSSSRCTPSSTPEFPASVHVMAPLGCVSHKNEATGALQAYFSSGSGRRALTQPCCRHVWGAFARRCLLRFQAAPKKKRGNGQFLFPQVCWRSFCRSLVVVRALGCGVRVGWRQERRLKRELCAVVPSSSSVLSPLSSVPRGWGHFAFLS